MRNCHLTLIFCCFSDRVSSNHVSSSTGGFLRKMSSSSVIMPPGSPTRRQLNSTSTSGSASTSLYNHPSYYSIPPQLDFPGIAKIYICSFISASAPALLICLIICEHCHSSSICSLMSFYLFKGHLVKL